MVLRTIGEIGDPISNQRAKEIQNMIPYPKTLIADMAETIWAASGMGFTVSQVGILKRLVITECEEGELRVLINSEITEWGGEQTSYEGCLSVPGKTGTVTRPIYVIVEALSEEIQPVTVEGEELLTRALCHEIDCLDGHLYMEVAEELYMSGELEAMQEGKAAEERE